MREEKIHTPLPPTHTHKGHKTVYVYTRICTHPNKDNNAVGEETTERRGKSIAHKKEIAVQNIQFFSNILRHVDNKDRKIALSCVDIGSASEKGI